ncbi:hypothetical protein PQR11_18460 [Paraburkholderia strydomiana]|uniref:hypothetical protein n=1 Tax=Paraburkholderia strydomiana TaxID=1245417 RepID=UPI0038B7CBC8
MGRIEPERTSPASTIFFIRRQDGEEFGNPRPKGAGALELEVWIEEGMVGF